MTLGDCIVYKSYNFEDSDSDDQDAEEFSDLSDVFEEETNYDNNDNKNVESFISIDDISYDRDLKFVNVPSGSRPKHTVLTQTNSHSLKNIQSTVNLNANELENLDAHYIKLDSMKRDHDNKFLIDVSDGNKSYSKSSTSKTSLPIRSSRRGGRRARERRERNSSQQQLPQQEQQRRRNIFDVDEEEDEEREEECIQYGSNNTTTIKQRNNRSKEYSLNEGINRISLSHSSNIFKELSATAAEDVVVVSEQGNMRHNTASVSQYHSHSNNNSNNGLNTTYYVRKTLQAQLDQQQQPDNDDNRIDVTMDTATTTMVFNSKKYNQTNPSIRQYHSKHSLGGSGVIDYPINNNHPKPNRNNGRPPHHTQQPYNNRDIADEYEGDMNNSSTSNAFNHRGHSNSYLKQQQFLQQQQHQEEGEEVMDDVMIPNSYNNNYSYSSNYSNNYQNYQSNHMIQEGYSNNNHRRQHSSTTSYRNNNPHPNPSFQYKYRDQTNTTTNTYENNKTIPSMNNKYHKKQQQYINKVSMINHSNYLIMDDMNLSGTLNPKASEFVPGNFMNTRTS